MLEPIKEFDINKYDFKGFIDLVIKTKDGKYHIIDWKTCTWGWDSRKKNDSLINYQLVLYKNKVEIFRATSGNKKMQNAVNLLKKALYNIERKAFIKNRLSCKGCEFNKTSHCP